MLNLNVNFNQNAEVRESEYLKGGEIHPDVYLQEFKLSEIDSKDKTEKYPVLTITLGNDKGQSITKNLFIPRTQADLERKEGNNGKPMASTWDHLSFNIKHILSVFNPKGLEKLENGGQFSLGEYLDLSVKALAPKLNKKEAAVFMKVMLNKTGFADFPYIVAIGKDGEPFMTSLYLSADESKLSFSDYDIKTINQGKEANAKRVAARPTQMSDSSTKTSGGSIEDDLADIDEEDFDFE